MITIYVLEVLLLFAFFINTLYVLIFSVASKLGRIKKHGVDCCDNVDLKKFLILFPAYAEDDVIIDSVKHALSQDYSKDLYDVVVISDHMKNTTNEKIKALGASVDIVTFKNSTKAKSLDYALNNHSGYDNCVVLDADNIVKNNFLSGVNNFLNVNLDCKILQTHRTAKNINNRLAFLDAISEEMNNSIYRLGHRIMGLSSALIGSGMVFDYELLKATTKNLESMGEDREMELIFLRDGYKIYYAEDIYVYDEKVQKQLDFTNQRGRWISAQFLNFFKFSKFLIPQLKLKNLDFIDKLYQQIQVPRLLLLGLSVLFLVISCFVNILFVYSWLILLLVLSFALFLAIPSPYLGKKLFSAMLILPSTFFSMFLALFKARKSGKTFIHTKHGEN